MGFLNSLSNMLSSTPKKGYDMDSLDGINNIPVPCRDVNAYYVLQRKATEHKKNGNMDLAIACLRKSNALSDSVPRTPLLEKDYLRLVKYLKLAGKHDEASREEALIYSRHPEFKDKRISNLTRIRETLAKCKRDNVDTVIISTRKTCDVCKNYNHKIYSISGTNKKYKKIPFEFIQNGGFCPNCSVSISPYYKK